MVSRNSRYLLPVLPRLSSAAFTFASTSLSPVSSTSTVAEVRSLGESICGAAGGARRGLPEWLPAQPASGCRPLMAPRGPAQLSFELMCTALLSPGLRCVRAHTSLAASSGASQPTCLAALRLPRLPSQGGAVRGGWITGPAECLGQAGRWVAPRGGCGRFRGCGFSSPPAPSVAH